MTPPLPNPPTLEHLPSSVIHAALLRGDIVRCGPGVRPIGWPETPRVRAHALTLAPGRVASHLTAAWVWGAARHPGVPLHATVTDRRRRDPVRDAALALHHRPCPELDLVRFGATAVTTPRRTLIDLLHEPGAEDGFPQTARIACRLLSRSTPGGIDAIPLPDILAGRASSRARIEARLARL